MHNQQNIILVLHEQGMRNRDIAGKLGVAPLNVRRTIKRFQELVHIGDRPRSGTKCTTNTTRNRQLIKKRIQRNSTVSMRKIARETGISRESVRRIAKHEFLVEPYKLQRVQLVTADNKRLSTTGRCRRLLRRVRPLNFERILFTDEKLFAIAQAHNRTIMSLSLSHKPTINRTT